MFLQDENLPCTILQRDRDTTYVQTFDDVFTGEGHTVKVTPARAPKPLNACCVVNEKHVDHILKIGADWHNNRRGHSARDHLPPVRDSGDPPVVDLAKHKFVCHTELGGHLKSYRAA